MAEPESRKGGGAKTSRSETVTVRLDPRLRYLAETAARAHRRTLSSYIEWAVEESLKKVTLQWNLDDDEAPPSPTTVALQSGILWHVDEMDRFLFLAIAQPQLLTHDEQVLWKVLSEVLAIIDPSACIGGRIRLNQEAKETLRKGWPLLKDLAQEGADATVVAAAIAASLVKDAPTRQPVKAAAKKSRKAT